MAFEGTVISVRMQRAGESLAGQRSSQEGHRTGLKRQNLAGGSLLQNLNPHDCFHCRNPIPMPGKQCPGPRIRTVEGRTTSILRSKKINNRRSNFRTFTDVRTNPSAPHKSNLRHQSINLSHQCPLRIQDGDDDTNASDGTLQAFIPVDRLL